jgi:glycosyltransferase involved in cell wall biosynthesis
MAIAPSNDEITKTKRESSAIAVELLNQQRPLALLLDLSGDENAAMEWAAARLGNTHIRPLNKAELKWASKRDALALVRSLKPDIFCVFTSDVRIQGGRSALMIFAIFAGARWVMMGDARGRGKSRSRLGVLLREAPRFALELLAGYGLIVPLSWLLTEALGLSLAFRGPVRASRIAKSLIDPQRDRSMSGLYVRATLTSAAQGGMPTHVAGFASGAAALGHRLVFLVSGARADDRDSLSIQPSTLFTATKALFELWNNFAFTARSMPPTGPPANEFDFIYQRYNRFNWTGVLLSAVTGLPLALEFNGSEVWISTRWDPIGLLWLLKRFESLNLRAADLIFVVSEVERRNLIEAGVSPAKIIVNPNGVDTDRFRPNCGGGEIRRALDLEDKTVIGFVGTFGPWHGATTLAEAATRINDPRQICHFVFIGSGEQRAQTESIIAASAVNATFTGSISHEKVPAYLDACDVLASPHVRSTDGSQFFGSPTKLFEYLAMGKGIVASRLGQVGEVVIDGENGLLVEPGDADELAQAIERLAADRDLRERLGDAARKTAVERYTWRHNAARVFDAMRAML